LLTSPGCGDTLVFFDYIDYMPGERGPKPQRQPERGTGKKRELRACHRNPRFLEGLTEAKLRELVAAEAWRELKL
jgi:hypothetical protein